MDIVKQLKNKLQEAELYRKQGLLVEAKDSYETAAELLKENLHLENSQSLLDAVLKKKAALANDLNRFQENTKTPEVSKKAQALIMNLFSFSDKDNPEAAALEGAIALAKFGQHERALGEFEKLLQEDSLRVPAAKNILKCYIEISTLENAVAKFNNWFTTDLFSLDNLRKIHKFLKNIIDKKGADISLPQIPEDDIVTLVEDEAGEDDEILEVSSIGISIETDSGKRELHEIDVSFQSGNTLSIIFSGDEKKWLDKLDKGTLLNDVHFYSPIAMFTGSAVVAAKTQIKSGPKKGDYCLDIKMINL